MMKTILAGFMLVLLAAVPLAAEDLDNGTALYIEGLELLIDDRLDPALMNFQELVDEYPGSIYANRAGTYLRELRSSRDNSGIVTFYLGNLVTATYTAMQLPTIFNYELDPVLAGITGLTGVGTGLGSAWLMTKDSPMNSAQDWWIESTQLISLGNYLYLTGIVEPYTIWEYDTALKIELGGQLLTLLGSRIGAWAAFRNSSPPRGQGAFMLQGYAWANFYYLLFAGGVLEWDDSRGVSIAGMVISDLAAYGSTQLWQQLEWSPLRTGLVSVGGLGGGLIGVFTSLILEELIELDSRMLVGLVLASTMAGQAAAVHFTRDMPAESGWENRIAEQTEITILPQLGKDSIGAAIRISY